MYFMRSILLSLATLVLAPLASAESAPRVLDVTGAQVKRTEVRHGQIGPRDTILFYAFADQAAVLVLQVKHAAGTFIISGTVHLFAEDTNGGQLDKWINNQHSCGLFPDVPKPVTTTPLAADACMVTGSARKEGAELAAGPSGERFEDFAIQFKVADVQSGDLFKLKAFEAKTGAFVKAGPSA